MFYFSQPKSSAILFFMSISSCLGVCQFPPPEASPFHAGITLLECIRLTLKNDPLITSQEQILRQAEGRLQNQKGVFDPSLLIAVRGSETQRPTAISVGEDRLVTATEDGGFNMGATLSKLFRSGIEAKAEANLDRSDVKVNGNPTSSTGEVKLESSYPLLRGNGKAIVTSAEVVARREYLASQADYQHLVAERLLAAINGYWQFLAAEETYQIALESERRAEKLVEDTNELVAADELPRNELLQVKADLANKKSDRILAKNAVNQARQSLGQIMGLSPEMTNQLANPATAFPVLKNWQTPEPQASKTLVEKALRYRSDLQAARYRQDAANLNLAVARNDLKPNLDLNLQVSYNGLKEGSAFEEFHRALFEDVPGVSFSISLTLALPLKNQSARGNFLGSHASNRRTIILTENLERTIHIQVAQTASDFYSSFEALAASEISIEYSELALENEQNKFQLGFSTLVDLITFQDRLTSTQRIHINNYSQLMRNLTQLHFLTGNLGVGSPAVDQTYLERILNPPPYR